MPEESLKLVDIVSAFPSATSMLAVDRADSQSTRADTKYERILQNHEPDIEGEIRQPHLGSHRTTVFCVALDGKVEHRLLMLML